MLGREGGDVTEIQICLNSFNSRALLLQLVCYRMDEATSLSVSPAGSNRTEQQLQMSSKAFEDKMMEEAGQQEAPPTPERHYSLTQAVREERREMRFNR